MIHSKLTINKVISFIKENNLFEENDRLLLGISGGFDSTVLIDIIFKIKQLFKIQKIFIAHINYNLRGNDSINDKIFVESLSKKYDFEIFTLDIDLNSYIKFNNIKDSLENLARKIRYDFFKEISLKKDINKILLAHNSNDHAETILLKLIRGTVTGLKGIETKRNLENLKIIRPILCLSRQEIESYAIENNLSPHTDITNNENDYTRNRVRNNLLPLILKENPNFLESIYNSSVIFNKEDKYLDKLSNDALNKTLIEEKKDYIILDNNKLTNYDEILINRIIKNIFNKLQNDNKSFSYTHIKSIIDNINSNISNKIIELPNNYSFYKDKNYLIFSKKLIDLKPKEFNYEFEDKLNINELDLHIEIKEYKDDIKANKLNLAFSIKKIDKILIKNYEQNQEFIPFGKTSIIKVKELMDKNKIPKIIRKNLIMIYVNDIFIGIPNYIRTNELLFDTSLKTYYFIYL